MKPWETSGKPSQSRQKGRAPWQRPKGTAPGGDGSVGAYREFLDRALSLPGYDEFITRLESGGKADAKAPTSSATGLHQFTAATWSRMVSKAKPAWAEGLDESAIQGLRTDPEKSKEMESLLREENAAALSVAEQPITDVNLYAAHHFGASKGVRFAQASNDTPMAAILSTQQMQANKYLQGKTKGEAVSNWLKRGKKNAPWNKGAKT